MGIPDSEKATTDLLDFLTDACSDNVSVTTDTGTHIEQILNTKKVYYKTQMVNYPGFSRFVKELEDLEAMSEQVYDHMSKPRASVISKQIMSYVNSFRYSIDAKSSESLRDKHNTQGTLVHELLKNKVERAFTLKDEMKKSVFEGWFGKDGNSNE